MDEDDVTVQAPKRMFLGNSTVDIISNLPGNIVESILICLPIKDAARTSVLSKKWRLKWHYIPQLVFNDDDFALLGSEKQIWFQIFQVLALHRGPLQKFVLNIDIKACRMNQIILILSGKDIQELTLSLPYWKPRYKLVSTLFDCVHLKHLDLSACLVIPPLEFAGFSRLISVEFHRVKLSAKDFKTFISKCPLLEQLTIEDVNGKSPFEIDAPNLKFLYFDCRYSSVHFRNVPLLSTVKIEDCLDNTSSTAPDVVHVFYPLPAIEYFYSTFNSLCCFGSVIPERLPTMLSYLKTLELRSYLDCLRYVKFPLLLIKSFPNLQKFKIQLTATSWAVAEQEEEDEDCIEDYIAIKQFLKGESLVEYATNQLQEVTIKSFRCTEVELEFLKLLLVKSLVIKKVTIQLLDGGWNKSRDLKIQEEVSRLRKASQEAEIIFLDTHGTQIFMKQRRKQSRYKAIAGGTLK